MLLRTGPPRQRVDRASLAGLGDYSNFLKPPQPITDLAGGAPREPARLKSRQQQANPIWFAFEFLDELVDACDTFRKCLSDDGTTLRFQVSTAQRSGNDSTVDTVYQAKVDHNFCIRPSCLVRGDTRKRAHNCDGVPIRCQSICSQLDEDCEAREQLPSPPRKRPKPMNLLNSSSCFLGSTSHDTKVPVGSLFCRDIDPGDEQ